MFGRDALWVNALDLDSGLPVHKQALTIVVAHNPSYCLDACAAAVGNLECAFSEGASVIVNLCVSERLAQRVGAPF